MNKPGNKKYLATAGIIILLFVIGYFRDYIFVGINYRIASLTYNEFPDNLPPIPSFFLRFNIEELYLIKWILTILFTILYYSVSCLTVYYLFRQKKFIIYTTALFGAVFIISFIIIIMGYVIKNHDDTYTLSRHLM